MNDTADTIASLHDAWAQLGPIYDSAFNVPEVHKPLIDAANQNSARSYETSLAVIATILEKEPWLKDEAGYGWALHRHAYNTPLEALDQHRVLNSLVALAELSEGEDWQANLRPIVIRQIFRWGLSTAAPQIVTHGGWWILINPYAWHNVLHLGLHGLRSFMVETGVENPLLPSEFRAPLGWQRYARGLWLAGLQVDGLASCPIDSYQIECARDRVPFFDGSIIGQHECCDLAITTLFSLTSDFIVGHEVAHTVFHSSPRQPNPALREIEADRGALYALWRWERARDLSHLATGLSNRTYDLLSALLGSLFLVIANTLSHQHHGEAAEQGLREAAKRQDALLEFALNAPEGFALPADELAMIKHLRETALDFVRSCQDYFGQIDQATQRAARAAAQAGTREFYEQLAEVRGTHRKAPIATG